MDDFNEAILIVEDNDDDWIFIQRSFKKANFANKLFRCVQGEDALDFLKREGQYKGLTEKECPKPALVLLDLNLPGLDGKQVLTEIRSCEKLKRIPIVVLTTSLDKKDIEACYEIGANSYLKKPVEVNKLVTALEIMKSYWFGIVVRPE